MTMQELLFDDGAIWFFGVGIIASLLFILTILMLFTGGDGGLDADVSDSSDGAFKVLSFQGIVGFGLPRYANATLRLTALCPRGRAEVCRFKVSGLTSC